MSQYVADWTAQQVGGGLATTHLRKDKEDQAGALALRAGEMEPVWQNSELPLPWRLKKE
jgi:hypothetical protein